MRRRNAGFRPIKAPVLGQWQGSVIKAETARLGEISPRTDPNERLSMTYGARTEKEFTAKNAKIAKTRNRESLR
jgi:hypothetical protein